MTHQKVNQRFRLLANQGHLMRERGERSILNRLSVGDSQNAGVLVTETVRPQRGEWEGNVQSTVVAFLSRGGWSIRRVADTASRETGRDIEAERSGVRLWTTVKGYPAGTERTNPSTQARHWFMGALFDVILWRGEDADVRIAVALPKRQTYLNLAGRTKWFHRSANFSYLWVDEGAVEEEPPGLLAQVSTTS
jgi:hypothetical protein